MRTHVYKWSGIRIPSLIETPINRPPSTVNSAQFIYPPPGLDNNKTGPTISSGRPGRPAVLRSAAFSAWWLMLYSCLPAVTPVISEGKIPGQMVLTRIFILNEIRFGFVSFELCGGNYGWKRPARSFERWMTVWWSVRSLAQSSRLLTGSLGDAIRQGSHRSYERQQLS